MLHSSAAFLILCTVPLCYFFTVISDINLLSCTVHTSENLADSTILNNTLKSYALLKQAWL